jgi:hypothetical protein
MPTLHNFRGQTIPLETILTIHTSDDGKNMMPLYAARGLSQTLDPIDGASFTARTVNAELVDLSVSRFRKFKSTISGKDQRPPSRDDVWPGRVVYVGCAYLLSFPTIGGTPSRTVVSGSEFTEGNFTFYQPLIQFMILKPTGSFDEWQAGYDWSIPLEEV